MHTNTLIPIHIWGISSALLVYLEVHRPNSYTEGSEKFCIKEKGLL